jgi:hypothetical protein
MANCERILAIEILFKYHSQSAERMLVADIIQLSLAKSKASIASVV